MANQEHLEILKQGVEAWNEWRGKKPGVKPDLRNANFNNANLSRANFLKANLSGAWLIEADLSEAYLIAANLSRSILKDANLRDAYLQETHLTGAEFGRANLSDAKLRGANLSSTESKRTDFVRANLSGADLRETNLADADFRESIVDGDTLIAKCEVSRKTDFRTVGLDNARIDSDIKELLKYNIRRMNWEDWYKKRKILRLIAQPFWWVSDYGSSTERLLAVFFISSLLFVTIYSFNPDMIASLPVNDISGLMLFIRAFYFSIVTMTTLGFGDMYAEPGSFWGYMVLIAQVLLGYVLLGALITRLSVLFTGEGPPGTFAEDKGNSERDSG